MVCRNDQRVLLSHGANEVSFAGEVGTPTAQVRQHTTHGCSAWRWTHTPTYRTHGLLHTLAVTLRPRHAPVPRVIYKVLDALHQHIVRCIFAPGQNAVCRSTLTAAPPPHTGAHTRLLQASVPGSGCVTQYSKGLLLTAATFHVAARISCGCVATGLSRANVRGAAKAPHRQRVSRRTASAALWRARAPGSGATQRAKTQAQRDGQGGTSVL
jgi:hypothetical protein